MGDSSYRLNFDLRKKNEIQHLSQEQIPWERGCTSARKSILEWVKQLA